MNPYLRLELHLSPAGGGRSRPRDTQSERIWWGPVARRVFGLGLIESFCPAGRPLCEQRRDGGRGALLPPLDLCRLADRCPYGVLFAQSLTRRPPFALYLPPTEGEQELERLELTLFGAACELAGEALAGLAEGLRLGLGRERQRFSVAEVWQVGGEGGRDLLCRGTLAELPERLVPDRLEAPGGEIDSGEPVVVSLLSPTRFKAEGRLMTGSGPVDLEVLLGRIFERYEELYPDAARPKAHWSELLAAAKQVPLAEHDLRWIEVRDYSSRHRLEIHLGGKVGRLVYGEGAGAFAPWLRMGEILHVGKNPTSGCGRIEVTRAGHRANAS